MKGVSMIQLSDYLTTQEPHVNELVSKFISKDYMISSSQ